ncbi:hypothetical protein [Janibacter corallicola]|uniref:hypothetical protein n=1 Tax=Janibacter corallicola TaxID=415212 RepID=UPI000A41C686|nr:hypothetical protein [Janibacter corallicola]
MTVTTMRTARETHSPRMRCIWVPVTGADGRTHTEMRWVPDARPATSHRDAA